MHRGHTAAVQPESIMKKLLIAASVLTCLFSSAAFAAQAPTTSQQQQYQSSITSTTLTQQTSPLTRAQVEHELAVAQQDGELRYLNTWIYQGS
jgi:hypothetical protein